MSTLQPIQFLLHQLATNEGDRERYNQIADSYSEIEFRASIVDAPNGKVRLGGVFYSYYENITPHGDLFTQFLIRTCLSRIDGSDSDSVLGVLSSYCVQLNCYMAFDFELRNGKLLDQAIQALHDKMFELVPEYREFLATK